MALNHNSRVREIIFKSPICIMLYQIRPFIFAIIVKMGSYRYYQEIHTIHVIRQIILSILIYKAIDENFRPTPCVTIEHCLAICRPFDLFLYFYFMYTIPSGSTQQGSGAWRRQTLAKRENVDENGDKFRGKTSKIFMMGNKNTIRPSHKRTQTMF